jgi:hypothetical protein
VKKLSLAATLFAAAFFAVPGAARADGLGLRIGPEVELVYHTPGNGTQTITDNFPVAANLMLSYYLPSDILSIDLEVAEGFWLSKPNGISDSRIGTILRPGIRINPPVVPIYFRGAVPILVESPTPGASGQYGLRLGAGFNIPLVLFKIYIEGDVDFPSIGGGDFGTTRPGAFDTWQFVANAGLDFRF